MAQAEERHEPIRQSVHVDCPVEDAFRLFTEGFGEWWPLASFSTAGEEAESCEIESWVGGRVLERTRAGEEHVWGTVTDWDPPRRLGFTWDPAGTGGCEQVVEVEFLVEADGTRVTLTHSGWHLAGVAGCFARFAADAMVMTA
jgi:uncharacterized protein YndB with AHSA1/START domain